jgi:hypothetical protein
MGQIAFDDSQWPIVVVRYPKEIEQADFTAHLERVSTYVRRAEPWGMFNDSRGAGQPNARQRQAIATFYDQHEALVREHWRGTAIIFDSPLIVGVLTALTWLRPPPHPFKPFSNADEGRRWLEERFEPGRLQRVA